MYPYNKIYPPYTKEKQDFMRFLLKITNTSQRGMVKKLIFAAFIIYILINIATGKLSIQSMRRLKKKLTLYKNLIKMALGYN